ncbi:hypothetical protein Anapl_10438 [Anas platyrhynchos]|uniref:Uncharacterized protein n=1 Tax=Anas platyrhynchos TaxID=8839 RepID=R0JWE1_ANAPL|nr:hypothetical protein Anapl_10438 [Anas platyrhynchos]
MGITDSGSNKSFEEFYIEHVREKEQSINRAGIVQEDIQPPGILDSRVSIDRFKGLPEEGQQASPTQPKLHIFALESSLSLQEQTCFNGMDALNAATENISLNLAHSACMLDLPGYVAHQTWLCRGACRRWKFSLCGSVHATATSSSEKGGTCRVIQLGGGRQGAAPPERPYSHPSPVLAGCEGGKCYGSWFIPSLQSRTEEDSALLSTSDLKHVAEGWLGVAVGISGLSSLTSMHVILVKYFGGNLAFTFQICFIAPVGGSKLPSQQLSEYHTTPGLCERDVCLTATACSPRPASGNHILKEGCQNVREQLGFLTCHHYLFLSWPNHQQQTWRTEIVKMDETHVVTLLNTLSLYNTFRAFRHCACKVLSFHSHKCVAVCRQILIDAWQVIQVSLQGEGGLAGGLLGERRKLGEKGFKVEKHHTPEVTRHNMEGRQTAPFSLLLSDLQKFIMS